MIAASRFGVVVVPWCTVLQPDLSPPHLGHHSSYVEGHIRKAKNAYLMQRRCSDKELSPKGTQPLIVCGRCSNDMQRIRLRVVSEFLRCDTSHVYYFNFLHV